MILFWIVCKAVAELPAQTALMQNAPGCGGATRANSQRGAELPAPSSGEASRATEASGQSFPHLISLALDLVTKLGYHA